MDIHISRGYHDKDSSLAFKTAGTTKTAREKQQQQQQYGKFDIVTVTVKILYIVTINTVKSGHSCQRSSHTTSRVDIDLNGFRLIAYIHLHRCGF